MLRGVPEVISSDLLKALADMGHGDIIVIADAFYPPYSKSPHARSVHAKGNSAPQMIDAILELLPLDADFAEFPVLHMVPDEGTVPEDFERPQVWDDVIEIVEKHGYKKNCVGTIERSKFYDLAGRAFVTLCTSETQPYGCFILQKGLM